MGSNLNQIMGGFCGRMRVPIPSDHHASIYRGGSSEFPVELAEIRYSLRDENRRRFLAAGGDFYELITLHDLPPDEGIPSRRMGLELPDIGPMTVEMDANQVLVQLEQGFSIPPMRMNRLNDPETAEIFVQRTFRGFPNSLEVARLLLLDDPCGEFEDCFILSTVPRHIREAPVSLCLSPNRCQFFLGRPGEMRETAYVGHDAQDGVAEYWNTSDGTIIKRWKSDGGANWFFGPSPKEGRIPRVIPAQVVFKSHAEIDSTIGVRLEENDPTRSRTRHPGAPAWACDLMNADQVEERVRKLSGEIDRDLSLHLEAIEGLVILSGGSPIFVRDLVGIAASGGDIFFATYDNPDDREPALYRVAAGAFPVAAPRDGLAPGLLRELNII